MSWEILLKKVRSGEMDWADVWYYFQGNYRNKIFTPRWKFLIRPHIFEQIAWRFTRVPKECWEAGECKECGCSIPELQMADKTCDDICYRSMMAKERWENFKTNHGISEVSFSFEDFKTTVHVDKN